MKEVELNNEEGLKRLQKLIYEYARSYEKCFGVAEPMKMALFSRKFNKMCRRFGMSVEEVLVASGKFTLSHAPDGRGGMLVRTVDVAESVLANPALIDGEQWVIRRLRIEPASVGRMMNDLDGEFGTEHPFKLMKVLNALMDRGLVSQPDLDDGNKLRLLVK